MMPTTHAAAGKSSKHPAQLGYRMPAESEPHAATWLSWPRPDGISFPGAFDKVQPALAAMVDALGDSEPVNINVTGSCSLAAGATGGVDARSERGRALWFGLLFAVLMGVALKAPVYSRNRRP